MSSGKKHELTQHVVSFFYEKDQIDLECALKSWWVTPVTKPGMRLTSEGFDFFRECLEFHTFETDDCLAKPRNLILLDKKMDCAYFIKRKSGHKFLLFIFGSQQAMLATLYGDVKKFLQSLTLNS